MTLSSVYVTPLGEFKLFDYYVTTPIDPNHGPNGTFRSNEVSLRRRLCNVAKIVLYF